MNTKQEIINKINRIDDPDLLLEIDRWISSILNSSAPEEFSEDEIEAVHEGFEQHKAGDIISHEEAVKIFNEWLDAKITKLQGFSHHGYPEGFEKLYGSVKDESFTAPGR